MLRLLLILNLMLSVSQVMADHQTCGSCQTLIATDAIVGSLSINQNVSVDQALKDKFIKNNFHGHSSSSDFFDQPRNDDLEVPLIHILAISNVDSHRVSHWNDLVTETVGVLNQNLYIKRKLKDCKVVGADNLNQALTMLKVGRISVLVINNIELEHWPTEISKLSFHKNEIESFLIKKSWIMKNDSVDEMEAKNLIRLTSEIDPIIWQSTLN